MMRDSGFLDCVPQSQFHMENNPGNIEGSHPDYPHHARTVQPFRPSPEDCYGVHLAAGLGVHRSAYGVQPPSCQGYQPSSCPNADHNSHQHYPQAGGHDNCPDSMYDAECTGTRPLSDIMEPRHYLYGSTTWKGVPLPFNNPSYELLLPSSHGTFQLLPSPNPFVYIGRKRRGPEDRFHGPEQPLPISAKRPEVFGNEHGIELTTNHLGYRPQRRHFKERPSFILFN